MANEVNDGSDKVERINQGDRTSENTSKDSIIGGDRKDHQQIHQEASKAGQTFETFSDNDDDQSFKAIQPATDAFGIDFGDGTIETSKGKVEKKQTQDFFETKGQEALSAAQRLKPPMPDSIPLGGQNYEPDQLIAANVTPNPSVVSDATLPNPDEVKNPELPDDAVAQYQDVRNWHLQRDIVRSIQAPDVVHPLAGHELSIINKIPKGTWNAVSNMFSEFGNNGFSSQESEVLIKSILANELQHYDRIDQTDDTAARLTGSPVPKPGRPRDAVTLGHSQISVDGAKSLSQEFPQVKEYLQNHGYPPGKELEALLDPKMAPVFIAGNIAHNARMYERHGIPVNQETLAYGFNPDISFRKDDFQHKTPLTASETESLINRGIPVEKSILPFPNVLEKSEHLSNVKKWLDWLKKIGNK